MEQISSWYTVYTKPHWEKKVADYLTRKKIENYCPLNEITQQWHDRKKIAVQPLFTSYVFVRIPANQLVEVKKTEGVINFVYWLGSPAMVKNNEIETMQRFLKEFKEVQLEKVPVRPNAVVQILQGTFTGREEGLMDIDNGTVKVTLPSLGYALVGMFEKPVVEVREVRKQVLHTFKGPSLLKYKIA